MNIGSIVVKGDVDALKHALKSQHNRDRLNCYDVCGSTPIHYAVLYNRVDIVKILIDNGSMIDILSRGNHYNSGYTPIKRAISEGYDDIVRLLLDTNKDLLYTLDGYGLTPIHYAIKYGKISIVKLLFEIDNNVTIIPDKSNRLPLHYAINEHNNKKMINLLINLGYKTVDCRDIYGNTALHIAVMNGNSKSMKQLLRLGGNAIDIKNGCNNTPLITAVKYHTIAYNVVEYDEYDLDILLACSSLISREHYKTYCIQTYTEPVILSDDNIHDIRYDIYFNDSLAHQLLKSLIE